MRNDDEINISMCFSKTELSQCSDKPGDYEELLSILKSMRSDLIPKTMDASCINSSQHDAQQSRLSKRLSSSSSAIFKESKINNARGKTSDTAMHKYEMAKCISFSAKLSYQPTHKPLDLWKNIRASLMIDMTHILHRSI